jgi:hypothetical protein
MKSRTMLAVCVLMLSALACGEFVSTSTPQATPTPPPSASPVPTLTATPRATEAAADTQVAVVRQPVVRVRDAADGLPTGDYITAGQSVTILRVDGDWVQIQEPPGWVYIGCLEGLSEKGCEAR